MCLQHVMWLWRVFLKVCEDVPRFPWRLIVGLDLGFPDIKTVFLWTDCVRWPPIRSPWSCRALLLRTDSELWFLIGVQFLVTDYAFQVCVDSCTLFSSVLCNSSGKQRPGLSRTLSSWKKCRVLLYHHQMFTWLVLNDSSWVAIHVVTRQVFGFSLRLTSDDMISFNLVYFRQ